MDMCPVTTSRYVYNFLYYKNDYYIKYNNCFILETIRKRKRTAAKTL